MPKSSGLSGILRVVIRTGGWSQIEAEAKYRFVGEGQFPLPAYSEFMPAPYVGIKPYEPQRSSGPSTVRISDDDSLDIYEHEQIQELSPGLERIASHILFELAKLVRGTPHEMSRALLRDNPAWPASLVGGAKGSGFVQEPLTIALALALSRTQDDKGNVRWTLFGGSHEGPSAPIWRSFRQDDRERFARFVAWTTSSASLSLEGVRVLAAVSELPTFARPLLLADGDELAGVRVVVTFRPFANLPPGVQEAYLGGRLRLVPSPASLVFFEHPKYRKLAEMLPRATQIPLLHLFPRVEGGYGIRIPQSGWLDESDPAQRGLHGDHHRLVHRVVRTHRWQRAQRDQSLEGDGAFTDDVTVALFSTDPDDLGLYGKPMARNAQIWRDDYALLLDGPSATPLEIERAARIVDRGGRFGYRFFYPPMRAGRRELFWHLPLVAKLDPSTNSAQVFRDDPPLGYVTAEARSTEPDLPQITLSPRLLDRPGYLEAASVVDHKGQFHLTTSHNIRKLLESHDHLDEHLDMSLARASLNVPSNTTFEEWLARLPALFTDISVGDRVALQLRKIVGSAAASGEALTFDRTSTRDFEERLWKSIASLSEGAFRAKDNADNILVNKGKTGGSAAKGAKLVRSVGRDLERLGDHLHERYEALIEQHGMAGRAKVVDHLFRWETDFNFSWSAGWVRNQSREAHERNIVMVIPGRNRAEAIIMGDHYDTAYMEDVYESDRGGDGLRAAAAGADDNHSATTALWLAADVLLPLAKDGKLERDVWIVHLTGEEFPSDCLGARALVQAMVERRLRFTGAGGEIVDVSRVKAAGAFVLDMIAHNNERHRDIFQIAPGEGVQSARLARRVHLANERWNAHAKKENISPERVGRGRAQRRETGIEVPPPFAHLEVFGEIRAEWEPRSALYNTDGQIFSDAGIPVVLLMENYDISRTGYHDTQDTMKNIDLDYATAVTAIAIEAVADVATATTV